MLSSYATEGATVVNLGTFRATRSIPQSIVRPEPAAPAAPAPVASDRLGRPIFAGDRVRVRDHGDAIGVVLRAAERCDALIVQCTGARIGARPEAVELIAADLPAADLSPGQLGLCLAAADAGDAILP